MAQAMKRRKVRRMAEEENEISAEPATTGLHGENPDSTANPSPSISEIHTYLSIWKDQDLNRKTDIVACTLPLYRQKQQWTLGRIKSYFHKSADDHEEKDVGFICPGLPSPNSPMHTKAFDNAAWPIDTYLTFCKEWNISWTCVIGEKMGALHVVNPNHATWVLFHQGAATFVHHFNDNDHGDNAGVSVHTKCAGQLRVIAPWERLSILFQEDTLLQVGTELGT